jgi:hypothetical protein
MAMTGSPNVDKAMQPSTLSVGPREDMVNVDISTDADLDEELLDVDLGEGEEEGAAQIEEFGGNLAEVIPEGVLGKLATELVHLYDIDKDSRKKWEKSFMKGMELLGMTMEDRTEPWPGASGVYHPVMQETAIQFQAHAIMELFPASGPARTKIFGEETEERMQRAERVEKELNYQITEKMSEYRDETEQLLYRTALCGSGFKKVYRDEALGRPVSMFVPAEDFIAPYGASDLKSCERYTHVLKRTANELKRSMKRGFYLDQSIPAPVAQYSDVRQKIDKLVGERPTMEIDDRHTILEMHADLDLSEYDYEDSLGEEGIAIPYVVTIEYQSSKVLSIRRNWLEGDENKSKRTHFVHYKYLPGLGFYGNGLIHLVGGLTKAATSLLRQIIDSGTLSVLPAGFKARGFRVKGDDSPLRPGEFRDIDVPASAIRDGIFPLPFKEPSMVLFQLLGSVVDEARKVGSVPDMDITDLQEGLPVGTTLAVLERSMKVMSAVQARMHAALRIELGLIAEIIRDMDGNYEYGAPEEFVRQEDFADKFSIIPVSDPNASTMAQRVIQYQTVLQLAAGQPLLYDMPLLHRRMLDYIGVEGAKDFVKLPDEHKPMDPVSENMAMITGKPVKAHLIQDHQSHIAVHMAAAKDPKIVAMVQQSPTAAAVMGAMAAHVLEHLAFAYRQEIEKSMGVALPETDEKLPPGVEAQLSQLVAQAAQKVLQGNQAEAAQQQAQETQQDPLFQLEMAKLALQGKKLEGQQHQAASKSLMDIMNLMARDENDKARIVADLLKSDKQLTTQKASQAAKLVTDISKTIATQEKGRFGDR